MQSFGIGVTEFELDVLAVALDCFAADAKLFCDLTGAVPAAISANTAISRFELFGLKRDARKCAYKPLELAAGSVAQSDRLSATKGQPPNEISSAEDSVFC
jgi:hypothetical protein